jgi:hypothetical protein
MAYGSYGRGRFYKIGTDESKNKYLPRGKVSSTLIEEAYRNSQSEYGDNDSEDMRTLYDWLNNECTTSEISFILFDWNYVAWRIMKRTIDRRRKS